MACAIRVGGTIRDDILNPAIPLGSLKKIRRGMTLSFRCKGTMINQYMGVAASTFQVVCIQSLWVLSKGAMNKNLVVWGI